MTKKVTRSPNYPALSLSEAVEKIKLVHNEIQMHPASKEVIAKTLGYGGVNGSSNAILSALQKYSLLEPKGEDLKLTSLAQDILIYPHGSSERIEAIKSVAFLPGVFQELLNKYGLNLPNDLVMTPNLIKMGFNPKSVSSVLRTFRDTIDFVKEEGTLGDKPSKNPVNEMPETSTQSQTEHTSKLQSGSNASSINPTITGTGFENQRVTANALSLKPGEVTDSQRIRVSRRGYVDITFYTESEVTQEIIEKLMSLLENMKDTYPSEKELAQARKAIWHSNEYDREVLVTGALGDHDGKRYFGIEGSSTGVPEDELEFEEG